MGRLIPPKHSHGHNFDHSWMQNRGQSWLEGGGKAQGYTSGRTDGIAREKSAEVNNIENVTEILAVDLKPGLEVVRLIHVGTRRGIDLKRWIDASASKINTIDYLLAVFGERLLFGAFEFEG